MEEEQKQSDDVPTLRSFRLIELKVKIDTLAREGWFIHLQEKKLKDIRRRSHSKIIIKYLEKDEDFVDEDVSRLKKDLSEEEYTEDVSRLKIDLSEEEYTNLRMKRRYQKARNIALEKHPEIFSNPIHMKNELTRRNLCEHRRIIVAREIRACYLAYGFIRGKRYSEIEVNPRWKLVNPDRAIPDWLTMRDILIKFTDYDKRKMIDKKQLLEKIHAWKGN